MAETEVLPRLDPQGNSCGGSEVCVDLAPPLAMLTGYFFSTIQGLKHNFINVVEGQGLTVLEAKVDYHRKDGRQVTVPVVTVLERKGELVSSLRIYFDVAPVYA